MPKSGTILMMPTTTSYSFGDIVLVPFPFTDQSASKKRPAVVISSELYHLERRDVVLMAVTSQMRSDSSSEAEISEWQAAGLLKPSVFKPVLTTVEPSLIIRKLGRVGEKDAQSLRSILQVIFG